MHRTAILELINNYHPKNRLEQSFKQDLLAFIKANGDCFKRSLQIGHITGSSWIVNQSCNKALLTHHNKLDRWLQLGGHADGDTDVIAVASREAYEESGLTSLRLISNEIFDIDIHSIPGRKAEPQHLHYDIRFLFEADDEEPFHVSSESKSLKWVPFQSLSDHTQHNESILRMAEKCRKR